MVDKWQCEVGDVRITRVVESTLQLSLDLFPASSPDLVKDVKWIPGHSVSSGMDLNIFIQAFVIESSGAKFLVDPCVGNGRHRSIRELTMLDTPFLGRLTQAGFPPDSIDLVICTHLHFDHVGWNTHFSKGEWIPTFPNARYLFGRTDWELNLKDLSTLSDEQRRVDPDTSTFTLTPDTRRAFRPKSRIRLNPSSGQI